MPDQPPPAFAGWARIPRGRWRVVAAAATYGECVQRLLDAIDAEPAQAEGVVLPAGHHPNDGRRPR